MDVRNVSKHVEGGVEVRISASPNSDRKGTDGMNEWRKSITVRIRSPPADGKANRETEEYIKGITGCRSEIIKGHTSRQKIVMVYGDADEIIRSLEASV